MVPPAYLLSQLYTFLKVQVDFLFFWLSPEAEPSGHSIELNLI
jgi:hypothetical protein